MNASEKIDQAIDEQAPIIHSSADVSPKAHLGSNSRVWNRAQIREGAVLGKNCIVGKDAYIDADVVIGDNVKIQNSALIYHGVTLEDGVFVGPQVCLTNDRYPRAITPEGALKGTDDWVVDRTVVRHGASLGAASVIVAGVEIGRFAMVGAGAVVTRDVPPHALVIGTPARIAGWVCACGHKLVVQGSHGVCPSCGRAYEMTKNAISEEIFEIAQGVLE